MSIRDAKVTLAYTMNPTTVATHATPDAIDFGTNEDVWGVAITPDKGRGTPVHFRAQVITTATSGGSATVQALIQDSADGSSYATIASGPAVPVAQLAAGKELFEITLPTTHRRYVRAALAIGTAALTAGVFSVWFGMEAG